MRTRLLTVLAAFSILTQGIAGPEVQPALDAKVVALADRVAKDPGSTTAVLDIIEMADLWDLTTPGLLEERIEKLGKVKKIGPEASLRLRDLGREKLVHEGRIDAAHEAVVEAGIVDRWLVVGPFDNEDRAGHGREFGPEADPDRPFDTEIGFAGDERAVSWRAVDSARTTGRVDLGNFLYPATKVCGFAGTYFEMEGPSEVVVWAAAGGTLMLWVDGTVAIDDPVYRSLGLDRHASSVKLGKGTHRILAKVCVDAGSWNLVVRLTSRSGKPLAHAATLEPAKPYGPTGKGPAPAAFPHAFRTLSDAVEQRPGDPAALASLARYMYLTGSDDLTQTVAGDYARKAADLTGACDDLVLLAKTTDDPHIGLDALRQCTIVDPGNAEAGYLHALGARGGMGQADFQNLVRDLARRFPDDLHVQLLALQHLESMGLPKKAYADLAKLVTRIGEPAALVRAGAYLAGQVEGTDVEKAWKERLVAVRSDDDSRRDLLDLALGRGDEAGARAHLDVILAANPDDLGELAYAASKYMDMGLVEEAGEMRVRATQVSPHDPSVWQQLGLHHKLIGNDDLALSAFTTVIDLNPNNVEVREYLAHLYPTSKFEREFAISEEEIRALDDALEAAGEGSSASKAIRAFDATVLVEQEVSRVFGNGMASSFVQQAVRVNTEKGEKLYRYLPIGYSPSNETLDILAARVLHPDGTAVDAAGTFDIPVYDPDVRIYYDVIQTVIEMPPLRKGDIVEVRYKISDASPRNMWERHFGKVVAIQGTSPVAFFRCGFITPHDLEIHVQVSPDAGLSESAENRAPGENETEATTLHLYERKDIPAIEREPRMPPIAEISPLIKVSTFDTWEEFGKWWWGFSSQVMVADKAIEDKVDELVEGKTTEAEKVAAVFDWVIRSTRYIALEFGVHGYKPYPSPLVVSRGFGDCKDKATLLYVMLREAGVDAALALVRTRGSGEIGSDFPFQFQFDHAIAYVPSLGLFLDGTVNYLGTGTLPPGDQDVFALVVQSDKVTTMRTPRLPHDRNRQSADLRFTLEPDGDARVTGTILMAGISTSYYRNTYQSQGTREERFEDEISEIFPGFSLETLSFQGMDEYGSDVAIQFEGSIPNYALAHDGDLQFVVLPSHDLLESFASLSSRVYEVDVGYPRMFVDTYTYEAPQGMEFIDVPTPLALGKKGDPYWYSLSTTMDAPNRLVASAELGFDAFRVPVKDYASFREFCRQVDDAMGQRAHASGVQP